MPDKKSRKYRKCPYCGKKLSAGLASCTSCGSIIDSLGHVTKERAEEGMDEHKEISLCPSCGSLLGGKTEKCPLCGLKLKDYEPIGAKYDEKVSVKDDEKKTALFMCPECGAFLSEKATSCPICKAEITGEYEVVEEPTEGEIEGRVCTYCHSELPADAVKCRVCGEEIAESFKCPHCGVNLSKGATVCSGCGTEFVKGKKDRVEEGVEEDIDKFFDELKSLASDEPLPTPSKPVSEKVETKTPATLALRPSAKVKWVGLKTERKLEFLLYAAIMTLIIHYAGVQAGLQNIGYAAVILYGTLFLISLLLIFNLKIIKRLPKRFWVQFLGFIVSFSVPLKWYFSAPDLIDIPLLIAGVFLVVVGLAFSKEWKSSSESINLNIAYGFLLLFLVSLYGVVQPAESSKIGVLTAGILGAGFVILGFVTILYKKLALPTRLPVEGQPSEIRGGIPRKDYPKGIYGNDVPWYSKASALMLLDRYKEAHECSEIAIKINPKNEIAWVIKGNALSRLNKPMDALKAYNTAIKLNPMYEVAWNNKGNTLSRLKKYDEALRCYEEAIKLAPNYRDAWVNKGYVLARLGKYKDAASCADKVMSITPRAKAKSKPF